VAEARRTWFEQFAEVTLCRLVFLDEFGAMTNMARTHARGPRGERVVCRRPHGHWKVVSTIAAMTCRGMLTCGSFDGATDADTFEAFVGDVLVPHLKPGQVVVMDNLSSHMPRRVDELVEAAGARVLRLPAYSPDFNPIEMAISKIKALLRKEGARTVEALLDAIAAAMVAVTEEDATNFIRHCGYAATAA
jgi:transposase